MVVVFYVVPPFLYTFCYSTVAQLYHDERHPLNRQWPVYLGKHVYVKIPITNKHNHNANNNVFVAFSPHARLFRRFMVAISVIRITYTMNARNGCHRSRQSCRHRNHGNTEHNEIISLRRAEHPNTPPTALITPFVFAGMCLGKQQSTTFKRRRRRRRRPRLIFSNRVLAPCPCSLVRPLVSVDSECGGDGLARARTPLVIPFARRSPDQTRQLLISLRY